jgi:hypothetical protein
MQIDNRPKLFMKIGKLNAPKPWWRANSSTDLDHNGLPGSVKLAAQPSIATSDRSSRFFAPQRHRAVPTHPQLGSTSVAALRL